MLAATGRIGGNGACWRQHGLLAATGYLRCNGASLMETEPVIGNGVPICGNGACLRQRGLLAATGPAGGNGDC